MSDFGVKNKLSPGSNMRWESSRMMIPEHVQALVQLQIDENRKKDPELHEQQVEEIDWKLQEAVESKTPVEITLFGDFGERTVVGMVTRIAIE